jgi:hypothetical protein
VSNRSDSLNRADGAIGSPSDGGAAWTDPGAAFSIISNQAGAASGDQRVAWLESSTSNVTVQVTAVVIGPNPGLVIRAIDNSNYLLCVFTTAGITCYKQVAAVFTQIGTTYLGAIANGDVMQFIPDASNLITAKQNGTTRFTVTEATHATGTKHGIRAHFDTTSRYASFSITDIGGAAKPFYYSSLNGLGSGGPFFHDRLA